MERAGEIPPEPFGDAAQSCWVRFFCGFATVIRALDDKRIITKENKMEIKISNGSTTAKNSPQHTPRCVDVSTHIIGRNVESSASHWSARDADHADGARGAYITFEVKADEVEYEIPASERDSFRQRSTEQVTFLDVEDARALRDALTVALDCADVK
jgi:hypothetical protein